ncbi:hypothetical protein [Prosthecobacter vanneervenii]|uniref:Uncharacterized protein n=1 Tax=Prosthecobacter vanneervenii TaxID=48466 RepID=A0A7W8DM52_9BACT|nr:hypothetical protein [Prosthecobacter vanneervenii]MBB5034536.1 hypothetical protein [Prosthecobacter vanneervenii]
MHSLPGRVIMFCGTHRGEASDCVEWALEALCQGYDSPSLRILAGLIPPFTTFEVRDYAMKALRELDISIPVGAAAISAYAKDLVLEIVVQPSLMQEPLRLLCDLCIAEDYQQDLYDFYLLRWAYDDLQQEPVQWYWNGADRSNIHQIILERCHAWLVEHNAKAT